jgi:DnaA-homolog protein
MLQLPLNVQLDDSSKFENYFVAGNQQVSSRLQSLINGGGEFVFVWGALESGKTHLAQALCNQFDLANLSAVYLPLDNKQLMPEILNGMSVMELVCLDNVNAIEGQLDWETAIFDLYNNIKTEGNSLVIFSRTPPSQMLLKLADLSSRLTAMEVYKLMSLDEPQKISFFQQRAENRGIEITDEVARFVLSRHSRSVKDLIELLDLIDHSTIALKRRVTIPLIKEIVNL